jgi:hypothetical protein
MSHPNAAGSAERAVHWTEEALRRAVTSLGRQLAGDDGVSAAVIDAVVALGQQPEILSALRQRRDPEEAVRDLCTRHAFAALMVAGQPFYTLDSMSQALIQHTLQRIYQRAAQVARCSGEDPLDEDPGLLLSICKCLSRYVPRRPMGAHISWKLRHYEGAVSRAMRQIENLVKRPEVSEPFVAHVLTTDLPQVFKAQLLQLARGGGRSGLDYATVIRFFALPATVTFVKRFAGTVQTARTLYDEEEYWQVTWRGRRRLPAKRRQGYLEAALASLERPHEVSLDVNALDMHDLLGVPSGTPGGASKGTTWRVPLGQAG